MTPKLFYGLTIAAAVSLAAAGTTYYSTRTWAPSTEQGDPLFPELAEAAANVASLNLQQGEETITIARNGDAWGISDRSGWPANTEEVREVIVGLTQMQIVEEKTRNEARYELLHLEDPAAKDAQSKLLRLDDENGKEIVTVVLGKIKFGVLGPGRNGTYVRKPGDPQTWLVSGSMDAPTDVRGWAQKAIFDIPKDDVSQIRISHPGDEDVVLARGEGDGAEIALVNVPEGSKLRSDADIGFITTAIAQLELWDVRKREEIKGDPEKEIISEIITKNGLTVFVNVVASEGDDNWVTVEAQAVGDAKQLADEINARADGWVFMIQSYKADNFKKRLSDLTEEDKPESDS
jgi:hypothetical protein